MSGRLESPEIALRDVSVGYGERTVLSGVRTVLPGGRISVILGGSGCGKSTLLRNIIGLVPIQSGRIVLGGRDMAAMDAAEQLAMRRRMGVLFQDGALLGSLRLGENIALPLREHTDLSDSLIEEVVRLKLRLVGLVDFLDYFPSELSGGMRKRAGLARAMALDPDILFFDEPSAGLDPISAHLLDELILELRDSLRATFVVVTHELPSIFAIGNNSVFLNVDTRTMSASGDPKELLAHSTDPNLRHFLTRGKE